MLHYKCNITYITHNNKEYEVCILEYYNPPPIRFVKLINKMNHNRALFNIFLVRIMCEELDDHEGSVSIGGRNAEEEAGVLIQPLQGTKWRSVQTRQR